MGTMEILFVRVVNSLPVHGNRSRDLVYAAVPPDALAVHLKNSKIKGSRLKTAFGDRRGQARRKERRIAETFHQHKEAEAWPSIGNAAVTRARLMRRSSPSKAKGRRALAVQTDSTAPEVIMHSASEAVSALRGLDIADIDVNDFQDGRSQLPSGVNEFILTIDTEIQVAERSQQVYSTIDAKI